MRFFLKCTARDIGTTSKKSAVVGPPGKTLENLFASDFQNPFDPPADGLRKGPEPWADFYGSYGKEMTRHGRENPNRMSQGIPPLSIGTRGKDECRDKPRQATMTETKKTARGLEEVSHFFLSRHSTQGESNEDAENKMSRRVQPCGTTL